MPIVVGKLAAQTPSLFRVRSSIPDATTSGGTHAKQAVSPGMTTLQPMERSQEVYRDAQVKKVQKMWTKVTTFIPECGRKLHPLTRQTPSKSAPSQGRPATDKRVLKHDARGIIIAALFFRVAVNHGLIY